MANIAALADRTVTITRRTAYVCDAQTAAASLTVSRQPIRASCVRVVVAGGTTGSGTVTITGTVGGTPGQSETLTFSANGTKSGTSQFTAISSVTTTGLADEATKPTVTVEAVDAGGAPQAQDVALLASVPACVRQSTGRWPVALPGSEVPDKWRLYLDVNEAVTFRRGDVVADDVTGGRWSVDAAPTATGALRASHLQVDVSRIP